MTYAEFRAMFPGHKKVTEQNFGSYLLAAETVVQDLMVYSVDELTEYGLGVYNAALALQIDHIATNGVTEGNMTSQNVNGVSASFALSAAGADAAKVSPLAKAKIRSAKLHLC